MSIGTNIRIYRETAGIPLKNFAERVKVPFEQMQSIEKETVPVSDFLTLLRICENIGGMRLEELLEENGKPKLLPMTLPKYVRDYLVTQLKNRNLTEEQLSKKIGVSRPTIARIMSGKYGNPTPAILQNVLSYFGTKASDLSSFYEMNYKEREQPKEEKKEESKVNLTETLYSLNDIVELSKAVKIYKNRDILVGEIDNMVKSLNYIKTLLLDD